MSDRAHSHTSPTLLARLKDLQDEEAWREFVNRYSGRIYQWCKQICRNSTDAEEATQVVLAKLANSMQTFSYDPDASGGFRGWLRRVARNVALDTLKTTSRGRGGGGSDVREQLANLPGLDTALDDLFAQEVLDLAMDRVRLHAEADGSKRWSIFEHRVLESHSIDETSARFSMTTNAVNVTVHRVRLAIEQELRVLDPDGME